MINFNYETSFRLRPELVYRNWIKGIIEGEGRIPGEVDFVLTTDATLLDMNQKFLNHDYFTDILTFDYSEGRYISGDIFISMDRVQENAAAYGTDTLEELKRVMAHGVLHLLGYNDSNEAEKLVMRKKEDEQIKKFHVEQ